MPRTRRLVNGEDFEVSDEHIVDYRVKLSSLANYMKEMQIPA